MILKKHYENKQILVTKYECKTERVVVLKMECNTIVINENRVDVFFLGQFDQSYEIPKKLTIFGDKREEGTVRVLGLPLMELSLTKYPNLRNDYGEIIFRNKVKFDTHLLFRELRSYKLLNGL